MTVTQEALCSLLKRTVPAASSTTHCFIGKLWDDLAKKMHMNKTSVLVTALRDLAKKEGVPETEEEETEEK